MNLATLLQILDEAVSISHNVNTFGKDINPSICHWIIRQTSLFGTSTGLGDGKLNSNQLYSAYELTLCYILYMNFISKLQVHFCVTSCTMDFISKLWVHFCVASCTMNFISKLWVHFCMAGTVTIIVYIRDRRGEFLSNLFGIWNN